LKYPIPLSKKGFYIIPYSETYNGTIPRWKVQTSKDGIVFDNIVPPNTTPFINGTLQKFTFPDSANYAYWRFQLIIINNAETAGISMLRWIPTLPDIFLPRKCLVGCVQRLVFNASYSGFEAYPSAGPTPHREQPTKMVSAIQPGFKAFKGDGSEFQWQPNRDIPPYWISITCPTHMRIWKVGLRRRNRTADRLYDWRIEGSNIGDGTHKIPIPESDLFFANSYTDRNWQILCTPPNNLIFPRVCIDN